MYYSAPKLALAIAMLLTVTSLIAADKPPRPKSITDIPPSNTAELNADQNAKMAFKHAAQKADAAMKQARDEGGEWREIANLLMQSSVVSRTGDFKKATRMAKQAQQMAEESYNTAIAAKKAEAEQKAAAAKKAAEEKSTAAKEDATDKKTAPAKP